MVLKKTLAGTMMLVGMIMGLMVGSPYAVPIPQAQEASADTPGAQAFASVCNTCHSTDRIRDYQGDKSWGEIITLMKSFGALLSEDQAKEIEQHLQTTYPRDKK